MKEKVLHFISHFQNPGTIKTFTEGCCYWFACILNARFLMSNNRCRMMYNQVSGHFACEIEGILYDITGEITDREHWESWVEWCLNEPVYREIVVRDCIMKEKED